MASEALTDMLNQAIARELQVAIQYMWQHVLWSGTKGFAVKDELKKIGVAEMKHAEAIAERLNYLGGIPTTKPEPIFVGKELKDMLMQDKKDEEGAIKLYKQIIATARKEEDETTKIMFQGILEDEEGHHDTFTTLLEEL
jgi:bacterioferritin